MTAPLPTREEIAEIIYEGWKAVEFGLARAPKWKDLDKKTADGFRAISDRLLTRLRPAFESYEAQVNHYINRVSELVEDCDALRASLARKDEALRACVEAMAQATQFDISPTFDARGSYTERKSKEWWDIRNRLEAALARPGVKEMKT